jgi:hypothetical protein
MEKFEFTEHAHRRYNPLKEEWVSGFTAQNKTTLAG